MSNPSQLLLLADHIKLSLLERQRAISLNLDPNPTQESHIFRSLESLREGLSNLESKKSQSTSPPPDPDTIRDIRSQYNDLSRQFHGDNLQSTTTSETLSSPNDPRLSADFERAQHIPPSSAAARQQTQRRSSNLKARDGGGNKSLSKSVRFRDSPSSPPPTGTNADVENEEQDPNRAALFPSRYTDEESHNNGPDEDATLDPTTDMSNQQIHAYHAQVIQEQDDQLDRLGESIGRQRHLTIQIGDELEGQIALLDDVDQGVDRHQSRLDVAKKRLQGVSKTASQNWGMTTIIILICILVLLIVVLK